MLRLCGVSARGKADFALPEPPESTTPSDPPADRSQGWLPRWKEPASHPYNNAYLEYAQQVLLAGEEGRPEDQVSNL
jgi:hypothetical protein